jgi:hypothetical protein
MMDYLQDLKAAIKRLHGCDSTHLETVPVKEEFRGAVVWAGDVEVYALHGHPKAAKCYAWSYPEGSGTKYVTMLGLPPVVDAQTAVKAAIAGGGA